MKLKYSPEAGEDLQRIYDYISSGLSNLISANKTIERIIKACAMLCDFPYLGLSVGNKFGIDSDLRLLVCGKHVVIYRVMNDCVYISRIVDGRTDYMRILMNEL